VVAELKMIRKSDSKIIQVTQDERWKAQWQEVMEFMETNKRRPS